MPRLRRACALVAGAATLLGVLVAVAAPTASAAGPIVGNAVAPTTASVAVGSADACVVRTGGTVACWGAGALAPPPDQAFVQVGVGDNRACGLTEVGTIVCWRHTVQAPRSGIWTQLSVGPAFSCALDLSRAATCWPSAPAPPAGAQFRQVSAGTSDACGVQLDGTLACWGSSALVPPDGQFTEVAVGDGAACAVGGDGTTQCWGALDSAPTSVTFVQVAMAGDHACGVQTDGEASCWGFTVPAGTLSGTFVAVATGVDRACGVHTDGSIACVGEGPAAPQVNAGHVQVAAGAGAGCAIRTDGTLACFGSPPDGLPAGGTYTDVAAGDGLGCAIGTDRALTCWGLDPGAVQLTGTFSAVATGDGFACAVGTDGSVHCTGTITGTPTTGSYLGVAAGGTHACALGTDSTVACWGDDSTVTTTVPTAQFLDVAAGDDFACGIQADATLACWGDDSDVVSGVPTGTYSSITAAGGYACALSTSGAATCWGATPATPPSATFVALSAGADTACGVAIDSSVTCWGTSLSVPDDLVVAPYTEDITLDPPTDPVFGGSGDVTVAGDVPASTVSLDSATPDACTVAGHTVSFLHARGCTVSAHRDATVDFAAADQSVSFAIAQATPAVDIDAPTGPVVGDTGSVSAQISPSGAITDGTTVAYSVDPSTADSCTLDHATNPPTITFAHAGACTLVAKLTEPDDSDYSNVMQMRTVSIGKATPLITVTAPGDGVVGQAIDLSASSNSLGSFRYSGDSATCDIAAGGAVTLLHAGTCTAQARQGATSDYLATTQTISFGVGAAPTQLAKPVVTSTSITVSVSSVYITPRGEVQFRVDGAEFGAPVTVDSSGNASLDAAVSSDKNHVVTAEYSDPQGDFIESSKSTARNNPRLTAHVSSTASKTSAGWYRAPVTVRFTCTKATGEVKCPAPTELATNAGNQSVSQTIVADDGGAATASVQHINIDQLQPTVSVAGITNGNTYLGNAPKIRCLATDSLSGVASCRIARTAHADGRTTYRATATDKAGNTATVAGSFRVQRYYLREAIYDASNNSYIVQTRTTYTLVALAHHRPQYFRPARLHHAPHLADARLTRSGKQSGLPRWTETVKFGTPLRKHTFWNIGVRAGGAMHLVKLRITG